MAISPTTA